MAFGFFLQKFPIISRGQCTCILFNPCYEADYNFFEGGGGVGLEISKRKFLHSKNAWEKNHAWRVVKKKNQASASFYYPGPVLDFKTILALALVNQNALCTT